MAAKEYYQNQGQRKNNYNNNNKSNNNNNKSNNNDVYKFINPYNFISLTECERPEEKGERISGVISCELTTKTPLIMIDTSTDQPKEHKFYPKTFMINNLPAIPASEIRGMLRSDFEILTNSCMSVLDPELKFSGRAKTLPLTIPAILDTSDPNNVCLFRAEKIPFKKKYDGDKKTGVSVSLEELNEFIDWMKLRKSYNKKVKGILRLGEKFGKLTTDFIFIKTNVVLSKDNNLLEKYETAAELHRHFNEKKRPKDKNHRAYTDQNLKPVWYRKINGKDYIALSQSGQIEYDNRLKHLLPGALHTYLPCDNTNHLCEACSIFGTVNGDMANTSKIRVGDALLKGGKEDYYLEKSLTLPILAEPKYTNRNFYLYYDADKDEQIPANWNVDFSSDNICRQALEIPEGKVKIRGRKVYFHHSPVLTNSEESNMNVTVRPLKENLTYTFKVYFDDITMEQLNHLVMALSLGNNSNYCHKIGLGKPLGFGSVKIKVLNVIRIDVEPDKSSMRLIRKKQSLNICDDSLENAFSKLSEKQIEEIKAVYNFNTITRNKRYKNIPVDYPREGPGEDNKIFDWFRKNSNKPLPFANGDLILRASKRGKGRR